MTAQLLTTELVSNALRHATGPIVLDVEVDAREVRVTVADSTSSGPVMIASGHEDTSGRGIKLVDALAQEWGVDQLPHQRGKSVWFTLNPAW